MKLQLILEYLTLLEQNNNREWYHGNKGLQQRASAEFEALVRELNLGLQTFDSDLPLWEPKQLCFKLVRDTRFSHDKSPYNPCFRAHIAEKGKLPVPVGYYLYLMPGNRSFLGGGLFADMFKDATSMVRESIAARGERWQEIISDPVFAKRFTVDGIKLKNLPSGYPQEHPQAEFLKHKSWFLELPVTDDQLLKEDFYDFALDAFMGMRDFNGFLNEALAEFQMPSR